MVTIQTLLELVTIVLALAGAYFVAYTVDTMRGRIDYKLLRAKAFLNESFIKDNWMLLFLGCLLFLIYATVKLNEMFGLLIDGSNSEFIQEITVLGVLSCSVLSEYKWFKLINPVKYNR